MSIDYLSREQQERARIRMAQDLIFSYACKGLVNSIKDLIEENDITHTNLTSALLGACQNGHLNCVKYLLETPVLREKINLYIHYEERQPTYVPDGALLHAHFNEHRDIVDYLLYDMKFEVNKDTIEYLKSKDQTDLLNKIEKHDVFFKLDEEMNIPKESDKKANKPKI
jgi:hypothetical protein